LQDVSNSCPQSYPELGAKLLLYEQPGLILLTNPSETVPKTAVQKTNTSLDAP
jgi:hypothetical protein